MYRKKIIQTNANYINMFCKKASQLQISDIIFVDGVLFNKKHCSKCNE